MPAITPTPPRPVVPGPTTPVPAPAPTRAQLKTAEAQLKLAGFRPGTVDGFVSPAFTKALKEFQMSWGLPQTGQLDTLTREKLARTARRIKSAKSDSFVATGQKSKNIGVIENRLAKLGYDVGKRDGVFDRKLGTAVLKFRADQPELPKGSRNVRGMCSLSQSVLKKEVAALAHAPERRRLAPSAAQNRLDRATAQAISTHSGLAEGAKGKAVQNVQKHLKAAGFDPQHTNGVFDERTGAMVKQFQSKSKLPVTGTVDGRTWKALQKSYILTKSKADPAQKLGERSGAVKASEALLKKLGFNPGKIDGLFDQRTLRAVKAYEKKAKLTQDGAIGTNQLAKMTKDLKAKSDWRNRVLETARRHLGFHERGENGNPFSKFFGRPPEPWCADFVSYCYTKAGKKLNEPWTPSLLAMMKQNGTYTRSHPKPGDIIMFDWHPGSGRSAEHTGLVEKVFRRNGRLFVQTIEGNSGDAVRRLTYAVGDARIAGFGSVS